MMAYLSSFYGTAIEDYKGGMNTLLVNPESEPQSGVD